MLFEKGIQLIFCHKRYSGMATTISGLYAHSWFSHCNGNVHTSDSEFCAVPFGSDVFQWREWFELHHMCTLRWGYRYHTLHSEDGGDT